MKDNPQTAKTAVCATFMENREIAGLLEELSNLIKILQEDARWQFKAAAYDRARRAIESYPERLEDMARDPKRKLTEIPGVGAEIALKIAELLQTGKMHYHQEQLAKVPPTLLDLLALQTVGPQKARLFYKELQIASVDELEAAATEGRLRTLPGMSAKSETNILKAIETYRRAAGRFRLDAAYETAEELSEFLRECPAVERVTPAGSLRRGRETVGDLDLIVIGRDHAAIADHFVKHPRVRDVLGKGEDKVSVRLTNDLQVDMRMLDAASYGAALQYFTGSKEHNVALRERARKRGFKLNEYGIFHGETRVAGADEEGIYGKLGLDWIPPELREMQGEIEAAEVHKLPRLIELADIRGDLQMHTTASDGHASVEDMAAAARDLGYAYILITDHSKAVTVARGLDERRAVENIQRIKAARERVPGIEIWAGAEVDILADGSLDYPDEILRQFDIVVATVHSRMTQPGEEMTERLVKALANPYVKIMGHPTGRRILQRDPFNFDVEKVFEAARKYGVIMEVNANPERLDLCDRHARLARERGIKVVISTDAHDPKHFRFMRYGVATARRGWMEKENVINSYPPEGLLAALRKAPAAM